MSGGGSSRPDASAGGFPAGAARGATGAAAEPPSLAQYLALDQFPVGEHRHSRSAELRRALGDSAEQPLVALAQGKPLPAAAAEELRRIRGGVVESSARAKYTLLLVSFTVFFRVHCCSGGGVAHGA